MSADFDEVEWLTAFNAVGGWCCVSDQGDIASGWEVFPRSDAEQDKAKRLYAEVFDHPQSYMRQRQVGSFLEFARESVG